MDIIINGTKADITLETEQTVGDVLRAIETECARHDATTVGIEIDGKTVTADDFDRAAAQSLADVRSVSLTTVTQEDISASFAEIGDSFEQLCGELEQISVQFQSGKDKQAAAAIKKLADTVDAFCRTATLSALFPERFAQLRIRDLSLSAFFKEFAPVLTDFEQALKDTDSVLIGDLAEYEIRPRIESIIEMIRSAQ